MWSLPQTVVVHGIKLLVQFPPTDLEFVPTSIREFFFLQAVLIFQENSGFPCKVFRNMKFTLLFGEFTHNFSPKIEILHCHFNFNKKGPKSFILKFTLFY